MPYLMNKICNAFEGSNHKARSDTKHKLKFKDKELSLKMMEDIWNCDKWRIGDLRTFCLTFDHFAKNAYSRMRIHLAVQFFWIQ